MTTCFKESSKYLLTSESVTEGHPDKLCDQIADAILDAILKDDPYGRVACEVAVTTGLVVVLGQITTSCYVDIPRVVRQVVRDVGYTYPEYGFDYQSLGVLVSVNEQSADIDLGVSKSLEAKREPHIHGSGDHNIHTRDTAGFFPGRMDRGRDIEPRPAFVGTHVFFAEGRRRRPEVRDVQARQRKAEIQAKRRDEGDMLRRDKRL